MTENPERRQYPRKKPEQLVYLELERNNGGMMLNVSEKGFSFRAVRPVRQEGKIRFAFTIDARRQLEGYGELEWADEDGKVGGLRFTEVSQGFREEIRQWLRESHAPGDRGRKSVPAVATRVDTLEEQRWDVKVESQKSLPAAPKVEKPGIARETLPAIAQLAMNVPRHDKRTAILAEQVLLKVEEKGTAVPERSRYVVAIRDLEESKVSGVPREHKLEERIQALEGLLRAREIPPARLNRAVVGIVVIGLTVLLVAAVHSFRQNIGESLIWWGEQMSGGPRQVRTETREAPTNVPGISPSGPPVADTPAEPADTSVAPVEAEPNASVSNSNVAAAPVTAEEEPGQSELAAAERILGSKSGPRDITGAMKLLWAAVEKGNTTAILKLSELYIRGEVTQKNCAQARVLLTTVAKKGDAGARTKLQQLDKEGCS